MNALAEQAAAKYGLNPGGLTPVASVYRPEAAYRAGGVLLKPYRYGEQQLYYATQALQHLERQGFTLVPRLVHSRSGQPYVRAGERWWYAVTWIKGRPPRFPIELPAAAASLADFHQASEGEFIPFHANRSWRRRWRALLVDLQTFQRLALAGESPFDRAFGYVAPYFIRQAEAALGALDRCDYDRLEEQVRRWRGFCHRDCTASNLVVDTTGAVCLVDPDTWGPDLRLHDLVRLLLSGAEHQPETALRAIAAYEREAPLDPAERRLLPDAYLLPREVWWAGACRYRRTAPGVDPERLLRDAIAAAPARETCTRRLREALG